MQAAGVVMNRLDEIAKIRVALDRLTNEHRVAMSSANLDLEAINKLQAKISIKDDELGKLFEREPHSTSDIRVELERAILIMAEKRSSAKTTS
jgi:hypothetical protein